MPALRSTRVSRGAEFNDGNRLPFVLRHFVFTVPQMKSPHLSRAAFSPLSRRRFLSQLSVGATALAAGPFIHAQSVTKPKKLGVALVGLGRYSDGQLGPALKLTKECELRGVVTGDPAKGAK